MKKILLLMMVLLAAVGCSDDDSITDVDPVVTDDTIQTVDNGDGSFSTVVNAGSFNATEWIYFSFANGEVTVTAPETDTTWDLRFKFYNVQLNGGFNGSAGIEIAYVDDVPFADVAAAAANGYVTDADGVDAFDTDGGWYTYNSQTHDTVLNGRVWFVHLADGSYLKLELDNLLDDAGSPGFPGFTWERF
jgi:hypothetical protein